MEHYIAIPTFDIYGIRQDDDIYPVDTDEEIKVAEQALAEADIEVTEVWRGEGPDAIVTDMRLWANSHGE